MLPSSCFVVSQRLWNDQHIVTRVAKVIHSHSLEPLYLFNPLMSTHINTKQIILYLNVQKTLRISIINENKGYFLETPLVVWGKKWASPQATYGCVWNLYRELFALCVWGHYSRSCTGLSPLTVLSKENESHVLFFPSCVPALNRQMTLAAIQCWLNTFNKKLLTQCQKSARKIYIFWYAVCRTHQWRVKTTEVSEQHSHTLFTTS